jgi:hypothetical protein
MIPMHRNLLALALCAALGNGNAAAADDAVPTGPLSCHPKCGWN